MADAGRKSGGADDIFTATVSVGTYQSVKTYAIASGKVFRYDIIFLARQLDGSHRAMFKRTGVFYKSGASVSIQDKTWHTDQTIKSSPSLDVKFLLGVADITLQVKNAVASPTIWLGKVIIDTI